MNIPRDLLVTFCLQQQNLQDFFFIASYFCWDFFFFNFFSLLCTQSWSGSTVLTLPLWDQVQLGPRIWVWSPVKAVPCTARLPQAFSHWLCGVKFKNHWELWKNQFHHTTLESMCNEIFNILIPGEFWDGFAHNKGVERSSSVIAFQTDSFSLSPFQLPSKFFPKKCICSDLVACFQ